MPQEIGTLLHNRYRIRAVIAQGGMGAIYRAYDESLGVEVALKENLFSSEVAIRQFHREATMLAALRHPNLPRVTDHFVMSGQGQYLVMDFIEGDDLRQRLGRQNITEEEAIAIGVAVCDALAFLHSRTPPIIHRDIKPGNVKITPNGQICLVDFGLAKVSTPGQATTTGAQALTPGYAPPEQYGQGTTPSSDIYALGATLYAALTGKIPEDALARAMGSAQLTPIHSHNPRLSDRMAQVIERAMAVRPQDRYLNANEFRLALLSASSVTRMIPGKDGQAATRQPSDLATDATVHGGFHHPLPTVATPVIPPFPQPVDVPRQTPPVRVHSRRPLIIVLACVVLIGIAAVGVLLFSKPPAALPAPTLTNPPEQVAATNPPPTQLPVQPSAAIISTSTIIPPTATFAISKPPPATQTLAPTPAGGGSGQIAFVSLRANNLPQIWLMNSDGSTPTQLTRLPDGACQPDWSPDGRRLVFVSPCRARQNEYRGSTLYLINADGTGLTLLPSMPGGDFDPAWSPDGKQIAFTSLRESIQHIFVINLIENKVTRLSAESSYDGKAAWSPDGKYIAFESTRLGSLQIWVVESNGQNTKMISIIPGSVAFSPSWSRDGQNLIYHRDESMPVLYIKQFKDMAPEFKVSENYRPIANAHFSTDGHWIVFESWKDNNYDIYSMANNGSNLAQLTADPGIDYSPVWRP